MKYFFKRKTFDITPEDTYLDTSDTQAFYIEHPNTGISQTLFFSTIVLLFLVLWSRSFQLQILASENTGNEYLTPLSRQTYIKPPRGNVYDSRGVLLASNTASFQLIFEPALLPENSSEQDAIFQRIQRFFQIPAEEISELKKSNQDIIVVKGDLSQEESILFEVEQDSYPGFRIDESRKRQYPYTSYLSHILGYIGKVSRDDLEQNSRYLRDDQIGKTGIERVYESLLRGEYGLQEQIGDSTHVARPPVPGSNIMLTIDWELQQYLHDTLQSTLEEQNLTKASAIVMNPQTGDILAMTSLPSYDNQLFINGISQADYQQLLDSPDNPLLNRAVAGEFPPASTVKPFVAGAFLEEGIVTTETTINDPEGRLVITSPWDSTQEYVYSDWKIHGTSDIYKSISNSVNVFYYTFSGGYKGIEGLGIDKLSHYYQHFGFGKQTGIDLPGEASGIIANPEWKKQIGAGNWFLGDTYNTSIGQGGMLATPLQIINATSAIANGGDVLKPHLYKGIYNPHTQQITNQNEPVVIQEDILSQEAIQIVREGMRRTVTEGTGYLLQDLPFSSGAKTGTAQVGQGIDNNSWFTAFAPFEEPEISMIVLIEQGREGFLTSIPVTEKVFRWYYENRGFSQPNE